MSKLKPDDIFETYGAFNDLTVGEKNPVASRRTLTTTEALSTVLEKHYTPDVLAGKSVYDGIVMASIATNTPNLQSNQAIIEFLADPPEEVLHFMYKVYIPEVEPRCITFSDRNGPSGEFTAAQRVMTLPNAILDASVQANQNMRAIEAGTYVQVIYSNQEKLKNPKIIAVGKKIIELNGKLNKTKGGLKTKFSSAKGGGGYSGGNKLDQLGTSLRENHPKTDELITGTGWATKANLTNRAEEELAAWKNLNENMVYPYAMGNKGSAPTSDGDDNAYMTKCGELAAGDATKLAKCLESYQRINKYWKSVIVAMRKPYGQYDMNRTTGDIHHWSAVYNSWLIRCAEEGGSLKADAPEGPAYWPRGAGSNHYYYSAACERNRENHKAKDGKTAWYAFSTYENIKVELGDVFVHGSPSRDKSEAKKRAEGKPTRKSSGTAAHGDVVYKIVGTKAYTMGGNIGNKGKVANGGTVVLNEDGTIANPAKPANRKKDPYNVVLKKVNKDYQ